MTNTQDLKLNHTTMGIERLSEQERTTYFCVTHGPMRPFFEGGPKRLKKKSDCLYCLLHK